MHSKGWGALNLKIAGAPDLDLCPLDLNNKNKSYFVCDSGDQCLPVEDLCNLQQFTPYCVDGSDVTKSANCKITTTTTDSTTTASTTSATTTSSTIRPWYPDDDWWDDDDDDDNWQNNWNYLHTKKRKQWWRSNSAIALIICLILGGASLYFCFVWMCNYKTQMTQRQYAQPFEAVAAPVLIGFINPTFEPGGYGTDDGADTADDDDDFVDGSYSFRNDAAIPGASKSAMQNPTYEEFSVPQDDDDSDDEEV